MYRRSLRQRLDFIEAALVFLMKKTEKIAMAQETLADAEVALATAVGTLADNFGLLDAAVTDGLAAIKAAATAGDIAAIHTQIDRIQALSTKMAADAADLKAATAPAAPAPAPAPEPAPEPAA